MREGDKIQLGAASVLRFTFHEDSDDDHQRELYESTLRDRLTGLFARGYFLNRLESDVAVALRHGKPLALVRFEVDRFAGVREALGDSAADHVLRNMCLTIVESTRSDDLLARLGDEDFAFLCRDVDALRASRAARRLRETIAAREVAGPESLRLTLSLGVADLALLHEPTADALIKAAESALTIARRTGGDRVEIYDPENEPTRLV
nr:GGDEF domain-containing protein [Nannocystis sp. SCPEA4]